MKEMIIPCIICDNKNNKVILVSNQFVFFMLRGKSSQFPTRKKIYIDDLGQLLSKKVMQPQIQVSNRLFPIDKIASKQHNRAKSSLLISNNKLSLQFNYKDHQPSQYSSRQTYRNNARTQQKKTRLPFFQSKSAQLANQPSKKGQKMTFYASNTPFYQFNSAKNYQSVSQNSSPEKTFLRKGSNIQKQIVINLLRSKIRRENQLTDNQCYEKDQIVKMIQVFKGIALQQQQKRQSKRAGLRYECLKDIKGWQDELSYQIQLGKQ